VRAGKKPSPNAWRGTYEQDRRREPMMRVKPGIVTAKQLLLNLEAIFVPK
jgi:hypothetical protein